MIKKLQNALVLVKNIFLLNWCLLSIFAFQIYSINSKDENMCCKSASGRWVYKLVSLFYIAYVILLLIYVIPKPEAMETPNLACKGCTMYVKLKVMSEKNNQNFLFCRNRRH